MPKSPQSQVVLPGVSAQRTGRPTLSGACRGDASRRLFAAVIGSLIGSLILCAAIGLTVGLLGMPKADAQSGLPAAKVIEGKVLGGNDQPITGAVVYLEDDKTNQIKTFITTKEGTYRFSQLPPGTDYEFWAEYKGEKSKHRTVTSFDTKSNVTYDFHLKAS